MGRQASNEGRYIGRVIDRAVNETGPNKLLTVILRFDLVAREENGEYVELAEPEGEEITGYFYLEKRDKSLNVFAIESLSAAFGWSQTDPFWFEDAESLPDVKLTLAWETYDAGRGPETRLKVKWINALDAVGGGGPRRASADERRAIQARLGAKFRAIAKPAPVRAAGATVRPGLAPGPTNSLDPTPYIGDEKDSAPGWAGGQVQGIRRQDGWQAGS